MTEPAHFPEHLVLCGPVTAERIRRLVLIYVAMLTAGLALVSMGPSTAWQIFGLGLVVPGGGFLVHVDMHTLSGLVHIGLVIVSLGSVDKQDSQEGRIVIHRLFSDGGKHGAVVDEQYGMAVSGAVFEGDLWSGRAQARQSSLGDGRYFLDCPHRLAVA